MGEGLFIIRAVLGALLFAHGCQKLFGWWGGHGLEGTGGFFHQVGHRPGRQMAALAGMSEAGGGALLFLGLLTPFGAAAVIGTMLVASVSVHKDNGLWASNGGYRPPLFFAPGGAGVAVPPPGRLSLGNGGGLEPSRWGGGPLSRFLSAVGAP